VTFQALVQPSEQRLPRKLKGIYLALVEMSEQGLSLSVSPSIQTRYSTADVEERHRQRHGRGALRKCGEAPCGRILLQGGRWPESFIARDPLVTAPLTAVPENSFRRYPAVKGLCRCT